MTSTAQVGGVLLRLQFPNGQSAHIWLHECFQETTQYRISRMAKFWGTPQICEPNLLPPRPANAQRAA